jgi:predicted enzyme related to lactoylglutathione lyase
MSSSEGTSSAKHQYKHPPVNCVAFTRIMVDDLDRAQAFFSSVFGWHFLYAPSEGPRVCTTGGDVMSGLHLRQPSGTQESFKNPGVVNYVMVDDVDATLKRLVEAGGKITKEKWTEGGHTELAEFEDTEGNLHGVLHWLKSE